MSIKDLPTINAILNFLSAVLLLWGRIQIRRGNMNNHRKLMISALITSVLFLITYSIYHAQAGSVPYPHHNWTRPVYFTVLIPHVILAGLMAPFILITVYNALKGNFMTHRKFAVWVWPVWMFVSVSGIIVYLMLYHL